MQNKDTTRSMNKAILKQQIQGEVALLVERNKDLEKENESLQAEISLLKVNTEESQDADTLFTTWINIVNTAQTTPDRCMVEICNTNFLAYSVPLHARLVQNNAWPIKIEPLRENDYETTEI